MEIFLGTSVPVRSAGIHHKIRPWKYKINYFTDGESLWNACAQSTEPALVLLDWQIGGMKAAEICWRATQDPPEQAPYLLVFSYTSTEDEMTTAFQAGADNFIQMPTPDIALHANLCTGKRIIESRRRQTEATQLRTLIETAGAIAHEINQPLSVIVGRTQLLQRKSNCAEAQRTAEILQRAGQRISTITQKMQRTCNYTTKQYCDSGRIIDFDQITE